MSLWSWVNAILICTHAVKHLPPYGKGARVTPIDHGASDHGRTRPQVREPVEIDVVENSSTVRCQCMVVECPEFLVAPMLRAQAGSNRKDFLAGRWRDEHLHADEISRAPFRAVLLNSLMSGLHNP